MRKVKSSHTNQGSIRRNMYQKGNIKVTLMNNSKKQLKDSTMKEVVIEEEVEEEAVEASEEDMEMKDHMIVKEEVATEVVIEAEEEEDITMLLDTDPKLKEVRANTLNPVRLKQ